MPNVMVAQPNYVALSVECWYRYRYLL